MGAYSSCIGKTENFDRLTPKFFYAHPNLKWVGTHTTNAANIPGVIKLGPLNLAVARVDVQTSNGTWYQTIGKVYSSRVYYYRVGDPLEINESRSIDVLVCRP
jgi:hypothetical protein